MGLIRANGAAVLMSVVAMFVTPPTDLRITDTRGAAVVVTGATIDYGGLLSTDKETEGIRVLQGDGVVHLKWINVDTLRVVKIDESVKPPRIELEVVLRSRKRVPAALLRQGQMKLLGKTELGDYSIDLEKVRTIVPIR